MNDNLARWLHEAIIDLTVAVRENTEALRALPAEPRTVITADAGALAQRLGMPMRVPYAGEERRKRTKDRRQRAMLGGKFAGVSDRRKTDRRI